MVCSVCGGNRQGSATSNFQLSTSNFEVKKTEARKKSGVPVDSSFRWNDIAGGRKGGLRWIGVADERMGAGLVYL